MTVACGAVVAGAVDVGVGDCYVARGFGAQDDMLSCDVGSLEKVSHILNSRKETANIR